jgi:branched-chain amino acid transport system substrate-binding protein
MSIYNREPDAVAMEGYDSIMVIAEAVKLSNSTEGNALVGALENKVNWEGTRGTINFHKEKSPDWAYHMWMDVPVFIIQYTELNQDPSKAAILWPAEFATAKSLFYPSK